MTRNDRMIGGVMICAFCKGDHSTHECTGSIILIKETVIGDQNDPDTDR